MYFSVKIKLHISYEWSAIRQTIHMKCEALFLLKINKKKKSLKIGLHISCELMFTAIVTSILWLRSRELLKIWESYEKFTVKFRDSQ